MNKTGRDTKIGKLLSFFLLLVVTQLYGQLYPVNVNMKMIPPYSVRLSEYTTSIRERMYVDLSLFDVNDLNRKVRLKLIIKRNNQVLCTSRDFVAGAPDITLDGGLPITLTNLDLAPYFRFENLQGISPQVYNNPLPDGYYQFCFEVYDFNTGRLFSKPGCDNVHLVQYEPPVLNLPRPGDIVSAELPQNIFFTWTPRGIPPSGTTYEFTLKELWDTQIDPRAAFQASPELYRTTTFDRSLLYDQIAPQLIDGKTYGWQVRAMTGDGIEETGLFKNNGYSEIFWFTYLSDCNPPDFILAEAISTNSERITWNPNIDHLAYRVQYRKVAYKEETEKDRQRREKRNKRRAERGKDPIEFDPEREDYEWYEVNSRNPYATIHNLEAGTTYEYRVGGQCHFGSGFSYSDPREFTTATKGETTYYNCGLIPEVTIDNRDPLQNLGVNETFTAGDFPVTVKEVRGANGRYSGWGFIVVPYLGDTKIRVVFNDIQINTDYQLVQGEVETAYDKDWGDVVDQEEVVETIKEIPDLIGDLAGIIADLFKKREEELKNLRQLQDDLANGNITQEEFDKQAEQIGINVKAIDEQINGTVADKIINSPYATEEEKKEAKDLELSQDLVSKDTDVDKELANQKAAGDRLNEIANAIDERAEEEANKEIAFENFEILQGIQNEEQTITYVSPAGVPVVLPKEAKPHFLKENSLKVPYGALSGFTLNDSIYNGYHKEGIFTGYKTAKGKDPYPFPESVSNTVKATIIQRIPYLDCQYFVVEGTYQAPISNKTGEGKLITKLSFTGELELVKNDLATYNECLPDISRIAYDEHLWGQYNTYGRGGFLRFTQAENGSLVYVYTVAEGENGSMVGWQYHVKSGKWYVFNEPPHDCLSCDLYYLFGAIFSTEAGHLVLDGLGMVPIVGEAFDATNGIWYTIEGEYGNAAISFASTIPLVYATTVKNIGRVVKLANGSYQVVKFSAKEAEGFIKQLKTLNLDDEALKLLNKDLNNKAFAEAIQKNPKLVEAWEMAAKHADLCINTTALSKLNDIAGRGRGIDKTKLKDALNGDLGDVLNKAKGDDLTNILNRLDAEHVTGTHLDEITKRLKTYPELQTDLLDNPNWFETFDNVLQNPGRYWEILSEGNIAFGSAMAKWGHGKWWKNLRDLADDFDVNIVNNSFKSEFGDANVVRQVTLEVTSKSGVQKTIRIDNLAFDDISGKYVLGDAKFTSKTKDWNTDWLSSCTDNQKDVFKWFENSDVQDIVVKATDSKKIDALDNISLKPGSKIDFNSTNLRLYGSDANQQSVKTIVNIK